MWWDDSTASWFEMLSEVNASPFKAPLTAQRRAEAGRRFFLRGQTRAELAEHLLCLSLAHIKTSSGSFT